MDGDLPDTRPTSLPADLPPDQPPTRPQPRTPNRTSPTPRARRAAPAAAAGLHSAALVRWLAGLQVAEVAPATQSFAERWSAWLDWPDAIALAAMLHDGPPAAPAAANPGAAASAQALITACQRARHDLAGAITSDRRLVTGPAASHSEPGYAPWRRLHQAHQRAMAARITPLRARVRAGLSAHSSALARLAALDAVLEAALAAREEHLLGGVPSWLEKASARAEPDAAARPEALGPQLQTALLAELDLRLEPLQGMVDALTDALASAAAPAAKTAQPAPGPA